MDDIMVGDGAEATKHGKLTVHSGRARPASRSPNHHPPRAQGTRVNKTLTHEGVMTHSPGPVFRNVP